MAVLAAVVGALAAVGGLYGSLAWDTPSGPSIVVAALILFLASLPPWRGLLARDGASSEGRAP
jgi:zinc transport system permease protein